MSDVHAAVVGKQGSGKAFLYQRAVYRAIQDGCRVEKTDMGMVFYGPEGQPDYDFSRLFR